MVGGGGGRPVWEVGGAAAGEVTGGWDGGRGGGVYSIATGAVAAVVQRLWWFDQRWRRGALGRLGLDNR